MPTTPLQALIFDVDGTLADTEHLHRVAFNEAFSRAGLDWQWDANTYRRLILVAGGRERIAHWQREHRAPGAPAWTSDSPEVRTLHASKTAIYTDWVGRGEIPLRDGVERLVREARASGLRLAIATTTSPPNIDALLGFSLGPDWRDFFEVIEDADTAPRRKPDPQVYQQALSRMGLTADACLAFEDSITGLQAAIAARLPTLVTPSHYTHHQDFRGALRVMPSLADVTVEQLHAWHGAQAG
jgi:HAD superfamily hydrolase (TIGR01509 family)